MEREKMIKEITFYLERIDERGLEILRKIATNLHWDMIHGRAAQ